MQEKRHRYAKNPLTTQTDNSLYIQKKIYFIKKLFFV